MTAKIGDIIKYQNKYIIIYDILNNKTIIGLLLSKKDFNFLTSCKFKKIIKYSSNYIIIKVKKTINKYGTLSQELVDIIIKHKITSLSINYYNIKHKKSKNIEKIRYAGRVFNYKEIENAISASLEFWLTNGKYEKIFTEDFKKFLNAKFVITTNSGSSANLLAISALTSYKLKEKRLLPGDEVITIASTFPTTLSPIIQNNLIPVFVDINIEDYNINANLIEKSISKKTKAIFIPHTLGIPFNIKKIKDICKKYNLWLIEDNCDALGSQYMKKFTGTFGDIATFSFYPAHHITMGEGGAIVTNNPDLYKIILSLRDWGRDCWCPPGKDNTCKARFSQKLGNLPFGYDHKYTYSHLGYNLKITEMQAAIGVAQLKKLKKFINKRKKNWYFFYSKLQKYSNFLLFTNLSKEMDISPFGFIITVQDNAPFSRNELTKFLEHNRIQTRNLFAGNILRHPALTNNKIPIRILNSKRIYSSNLNEKEYKLLPITEKIMNNTFWIGVWPGLQRDHLNYIIQKFEEFFKKYKAR